METNKSFGITIIAQKFRTMVATTALLISRDFSNTKKMEIKAVHMDG